MKVYSSGYAGIEYDRVDSVLPGMMTLGVLLLLGF